MSTDQALIEALEEHHKDASAQCAAMINEGVRPGKIVAVGDLREAVDRAVRIAFLAGAIEQVKNPLPPANK